MGVQAAPAGPHDRALAARVAQRLEAVLAADHVGERSGLVDRVREDVHAGLRCPVEGRLERIRLFPATVSLDDQQVHRIEARCLATARAPFPGVKQRVEKPDGQRAAIGQPAGMNPAEPARIGRVGTHRAVRRLFPGRVRQQQIDARRLLRPERLVDGNRIIPQVDRAQDACVKVPVLRPPEQSQGSPDLRIAGPPVGEQPMEVVGRAIAVQRHSHLNGVIGEQRAEPRVEQNAVGLDAQIQPRHWIDRGPQRAENPAQPIVAEQEWLTAMQDHVDRGEPMGLGVLPYAPGGLARDRLRYELGLGPPTLVSVLVHITVVAGKVTPACYLQHILTYRNRHPVVSYSGIKHHSRDG